MCQKACKKCDSFRPCTRCVKYKFPEACVDAPRKERKKGKRVKKPISEDDEDDEERREALAQEAANKAQAARGARSSTRKRTVVNQNKDEDDDYFEEDEPVAADDPGYEAFQPAPDYYNYVDPFYKQEEYKTEEFYAKPEPHEYYKPEEYQDYNSYYSYQPAENAEEPAAEEPLNAISHLGLTINTQVKRHDRPASAMDGYPRPSPVQDGYRPASADGYKAHNVLEAHGINFKPSSPSRSLPRHLPRHLSETLPTPNPTPTPPPSTFPPSPTHVSRLSAVTGVTVTPTTSPTNSKLALLAALCSERLSDTKEDETIEEPSLWRSQSMPEMNKLQLEAGV